MSTVEDEVACFKGHKARGLARDSQPMPLPGERACSIQDAKFFEGEAIRFESLAAENPSTRRS